MPQIISKSCDLIAKNKDEANHFAYHQIASKEHLQEDTLAWQTFDAEELGRYSPEQIGQRLWTAYRKVEAAIIPRKGELYYDNSGTTACTTVIKGNHLITATLGDTVSFAVIYDSSGAVSKVQRLNRVYKPNDEEQRIKDAGCFVWNNRVFRQVTQNAMAVSRALGDFDYPAICADAIIDITTLPEDAHHVQIIVASDGFTDGTEDQSQKGHEEYLKNALNIMNGGKPGLLNEQIIAMQLAEHALEWTKSSPDDISIAVQSVKMGGEPYAQRAMIGVYDGHNGGVFSKFAADEMGAELTRQLRLSEEEYAVQAESIQKNQAIYDRDNSPVPADLERCYQSLWQQTKIFIKHKRRSFGFYENTPSHHSLLIQASETLQASLSSFHQQLKTREINSQQYKEKCTAALTGCEQSFRKFRGETLYERYFGPWVRRFLSCLGGDYRKEYHLDTQVTASLQLFSSVKREVFGEAKGHEASHSLSSPK